MLSPDFLREIAPYRKAGALVDASLLLLLFIGSCGRDLIANFKRTRRYSEEDFDLIAELAGFFYPIATTPNILTEVSNFCGQLPERMHRDVFGNFREQIRVLTEMYVPSSDASDIEDFSLLGLSDSATVIAARYGLLVITDDFLLWSQLVAKSLATINFNHLRPLL